MEIKQAVPCIFCPLSKVHMSLMPAEGSCMTLSPMHLAVAARCILTEAQRRVTAVFWASQVLDTALQYMPETQCLPATFSTCQYI